MGVGEIGVASEPTLSINGIPTLVARLDGAEAITAEETLVFPNQLGGFIKGPNFRQRVFAKLIARVLGEGRRFSPHGLRHTWASLHMARGTPLEWIQEQGGWTTAKVLLDTYGHFMPTESRGFADALAAASDGPPRRPLVLAASATAAPSTRKALRSAGFRQVL